MCDGAIRRCVGRPFKVALLAAIAVTAVAGCADYSDWVRFRGEGGRGHTRNAMQPPLGVRWEFALQSDRDAFAFNNLVVKDNTLYFGSTDGNFYAMSIETGYMDWVFRTDAAVNSVPVADEDRVYFGSNDGHLYAIDRKTGEEAWSYRAGRAVQSTVAKYNDEIIFGVDGQGVRFLSLDGEPTNSIDNPVWLRVSLQVDDDLMYIVPGPPDNPRTLGVYDVVEHRHTWLLPDEVMSATWYSFPAINRERLFMQTSRMQGGDIVFNTWALGRDDGEIQWQREFESDFGDHPPRNVFTYWRSHTSVLDYQAPALWRDRLISASGDNVVRAFDEATGDIIWESYLSRRTSSAPMVSGDLVFVGVHGDEAETVSDGGAHQQQSRARLVVEEEEERVADERKEPRLVALSARSGRKVWELETNGAILSPPVVAGRYMVFGTDRNYVYVLERVLG